MSKDNVTPEALKFLNWLDPKATFFTFQTFDDDEERKDAKLIRILHGTLDECCADLVRLNNQGAGIFVTINETDHKGREATNIIRVRCVFVDLDGSPLEPVAHHSHKPHIIVASSPGRWHAYWKVDGLRLGEFENVQKRLIKRFDSDPAVKDLRRVMRLPGFLHRKGTPFLTHIDQANELPPYPADHFRDPATKEIEQEIERVCQTVREAAKGNRNNELNKAAFLFGQWIGAGLLDEDTARSKLIDAARAAGLSDSEIRKTLESGITAGKNKPYLAGTVLDPDDPIRSARQLVGVCFMENEQRTLHRHRGAFWSWTGRYYCLADDETVRAKIWEYLENARRLTNKGTPVPFKPKQTHVSNIEDALAAVCQLDQHIQPPVWLKPNDMPPSCEFLACSNGLLHLPSGDLYPPTAEYFGLSASDVLFNSDAPRPTQWFTFLDQLFGDDIEAIEALQDWFGYLLAPDTSQQKILLVVGPKRSGKGTIARVLAGVLGRESVAGPTMGSLGEGFGLEPLITAPMAIVSDARIGAHTDKSVVVERLLSISGEDQMTVARKYRQAWTGRLPTRFAIMTNELPALTDGSGALAGRFIILLLTKSFFGEEDPKLTKKLLAELSGILNWAIDGYRRLRTRGHFIQPRSAYDAMEEIEMLAAPVKAFIRDCCNVGPGLSVNVDELWGTYQMWAERQGQRNPGTKNWFGRNLRSAEPGITTKKLREHDQRERVYFGIEIKPEDDGLVELTVNVQHETLLEIYVHTSSGVVSLEKSFVSFYRKHNPVIAGGHADIRIPGWVARSKGLV